MTIVGRAHPTGSSRKTVTIQNRVVEMSYEKQYRCRTLTKVPCNVCSMKIQQRRPIDTKCPDCKVVKYRNVDRRKLKVWWAFLDKEHPGWTWCNVYKYEQGANGQELGRFQRKNILPERI